MVSTVRGSCTGRDVARYSATDFTRIHLLLVFILKRHDKRNRLFIYRGSQPLIKCLGDKVLVPNLPPEFFEGNDMVYRLPGDARQGHLSGEVEEDNLAAFLHEGSGSINASATITDGMK